MVYDGSMITSPSRNVRPFDRPAIYHICVQGVVAPSLSDSLEGKKIHLSSTVGEYRVTTLDGELNDQAALAGVLNTLYELHLPILMVMRLNVEEPFSEKQPRTIAAPGQPVDEHHKKS
jgi:hypothetical protein